MNSQTYTFETQAAADEFFSMLSYFRLPVRIQETRAAHGYDDDGRAILTVARRCFAQPEAGVAYTLIEQARRI